MAKKTARTTKKKTSTGAAKKTAKKAAGKKKTAKKPSSKKTVKKAATSASKKKTAKKPAKKTAKKAPAKKPATKKPASKKAPAKKTAATKTTKKAPAKKTAATSKAPAKTDAKDEKGKDGKPARKGITIVSDRPKKTKKKVVRPLIKPPQLGDLMGKSKRAPLIPSGPSQAEIAKKQRDATKRSSRKAKYPFTDADLAKYREILLVKRAELFGDMSSMESDALKSSSGGLSSTPQHIAEQGSDSYDQSLSLDLAAADRKLIIEIDAALERIRDKTFGLCELTGKAIKKTRLEELPWARYTIEAARELERRSGGFRP